MDKKGRKLGVIALTSNKSMNAPILSNKYGLTEKLLCSLSLYPDIPAPFERLFAA